MIHPARAYNGMIVTPHRLASEAGLAVLRKGGNAVRAAVAAFAALCVAYPHMTGLGGDAFWLILPASPANGTSRHVPVVIDASGRSALAASQDWYNARGCSCPPTRGPLAALTMAGAVSGWQKALEFASTWPEATPFSLTELFADALELAEKGCPVGSLQSLASAALLSELRAAAKNKGESPAWPAQSAKKAYANFSRHFLIEEAAPCAGSRLRLPLLGKTLRRLAEEGLDSFYTGSLAKEMATDLEEAGSPLRLQDFSTQQSIICPALSLRLGESPGSVFPRAWLYNSPPPSQGLSSLMIIGILDCLAMNKNWDFKKENLFVHAVVEATKQAFILRNRHLADPCGMQVTAGALLSRPRLEELAGNISLRHALPWPARPHEADGPDAWGAPRPGTDGDTVWLGVMDTWGNTVSAIQSVYHEFGSGVMLPRSGILWHNRGLGFRFEPGAPNSLEPGKKPFHTLNPALALLDTGLSLAYGSMGGDGQPQTQAAVLLRHILLKRTLQQAVTEPRWLLGRAWGAESHSLKLEKNFSPQTAKALKAMGHTTEWAPAFSSLMGHAGALARYGNGLLEGAYDPRSDGSASCW